MTRLANGIPLIPNQEQLAAQQAAMDIQARVMMANFAAQILAGEQLRTIEAADLAVHLAKRIMANCGLIKMSAPAAS